MAVYNFYFDYGVAGNDTVTVANNTALTPWKTLAAWDTNKVEIKALANAGNAVTLNFMGTDVSYSPDVDVDFQTGVDAKKMFNPQQDIGNNEDLDLRGIVASAIAPFIVKSYGAGKSPLALFSNQGWCISAYTNAYAYDPAFGDKVLESTAYPANNVWSFAGTTSTFNGLRENGVLLKRANSYLELDATHRYFYQSGAVSATSSSTGKLWFYKATGTPDDVHLSRCIENGTIDYTNSKHIVFDGIWTHANFYIESDNDAVDAEGVEWKNCRCQNGPGIHIGVIGNNAGGYGIKDSNIHDCTVLYCDGNDSIAMETTGNDAGINIVRNSHIYNNEIGYGDHDNRRESLLKIAGRVLGPMLQVWDGTLASVNADDVVYENLGVNSTGSIHGAFYYNKTGSVGTLPSGDATNWGKLGLNDREGVAFQNPIGSSIHDNYIHDGFGSGIALWVNDAGAYSDMLVYNNLITNTHGAAIGVLNAAAEVMTGLDVYSNIVIGHLPDPDEWNLTPGTGDGIRLNGNDSNASFRCRNNTIYDYINNINLASVARGWNINQNLSLSPRTNHVLRAEAPLAGVTTLDYNDYYPDGQFKILSTTYATLSAFVAGEAEDANSITRNPMLHNNAPAAATILEASLTGGLAGAQASAIAQCKPFTTSPLLNTPGTTDYGKLGFDGVSTLAIIGALANLAEAQLGGGGSGLTTKQIIFMRRRI